MDAIMKRGGRVALATLLALLCLSCATPTVEVGVLDFSKVADGAYTGSYKGQMGSATVSARIEGGRLGSLELTSLESSPIGAPAKAIIDRVLSAQSLAVDSISGATYSSRVILRSIQDALEKGLSK